jgi:hypothetical protein
MIRPSAIRSKTSSFSTFWTPRMMSLTVPWLKTQAMPIWVWLAPVYWCRRAKNRPISRLRSAAVVSTRCQKLSGIAIKSLARPGMPSSPPVSAGSRALTVRHLLRAYIPPGDSGAVWVYVRVAAILGE